jgi:hypothetical protein
MVVESAEGEINNIATVQSLRFDVLSEIKMLNMDFSVCL